MQGNEVRLCQQLAQLRVFNAELVRLFLGQERVIDHDLHLQAQGTFSDDRTDIAATDQAQGLARDLDAHEPAFLPFARPGRRVGFRDLPGTGQQQGDGMFGGRYRVAERRVHDDGTAARRGRQIDIVDTDAGAPDYLQIMRLVEQIFGDLCCRSEWPAHRICR